MTAREWFEKAQKEGFAIGAFNVDNLEIFRGICLAGQKKKSPVMVEFSPGEAGYFGLDNIVDLVENAKKEYQIPILLNLDHAQSVDECLKAVEIGLFDEVHFDGSKLAYDENLAHCKEVVLAAHAKNILVEGEIDHLPGSSEVHAEEIDLEALKKSYTDPQKAAKFIEETGVDIFAAVFGNVHGTFPTQPDLDFELLREIREALPETYISMHGGSGIPANQVKEAIRVGKIVKVNVNTELRQAFRDALGEKMGEVPQEGAYYKISPDIVEAVAAVVEGKIEVFDSSGKI